LPHFRYGAYLFKEQVAELVKPHPDTLELVGAWLAHHGIRTSSISTTHGGAWLTVTDVLVSQANQLLDASYQLYRNAETNDTIIRTVGYALPAVLHTHIQTVAPTTYFASMRVMRQTPRMRSFGTTQARAAAAASESGLADFQNEYPSPWDLATFMTLFRTDAVAATYIVGLVNGGLYDPNDPQPGVGHWHPVHRGHGVPDPGHLLQQR
jgi:tripeptidyl-peptidase-1